MMLSPVTKAIEHPHEIHQVHDVMFRDEWRAAHPEDAKRFDPMCIRFETGEEEEFQVARERYGLDFLPAARLRIRARCKQDGFAEVV